MVSSVTSTQPPGKKIRLLIVDDHAVVREGLALVLNRETDLEVCGEAAELGAALQLYFELKPDVVITDISLQKDNGIELIKELISRDKKLNILVWSMHEEDLYAERALRAGAKGFVNKSVPSSTLIEAIHCVAAGKVHLSPNMTERMLCRQVGGNAEASVSPMDLLSDRELEVFQRIGRGEPSREIAENLHLSVKTIDTYRENIKRKLNLKNAVELTKHAVQWMLENA